MGESMRCVLLPGERNHCEMNPAITLSSVKESIAYCGLICKLCFLASKCDGCKTEFNRCERNLSEEGCIQKSCCGERGFEGCWQCQDLKNCTHGIYSLGDYSKVKAFAICIQEDGIDAFVGYVLRNQSMGLNIEKGGDYDGRLIPSVLKMLRTGQE